MLNFDSGFGLTEMNKPVRVSGSLSVEVKELEEFPEQWSRSKLAWLCKKLLTHKQGVLVREWARQEDATYLTVHCLRIRENETAFRAILVTCTPCRGCGRLGGISSTISAYESLKLRGYDVVAVVLEDQGLVNDVPLLSYLRNRVLVLVLPPIPADMSDNLMAWFDKSYSVFGSLKEVMLSSYSERMQKLHDMPKKAVEIFWWPFTQHKLVPEENVIVVDSHYGENFSVHKIELARDMGYTTATFGHLMFLTNVYEPVLKCAEPFA